MEPKNRDHPLLHGVTLSHLLDTLIRIYGFDGLSRLININCFKSHASKESSLKFLRKTEWARLQIQGLYVRTMIEEERGIAHFIPEKIVEEERYTRPGNNNRSSGRVSEPRQYSSDTRKEYRGSTQKRYFE